MNRKPIVPKAPAITAQRVLDAVLELQRLGSDRVLQRLEANEPDLTECVLEGLSALHGELLKLGCRARATRQIYLQARSSSS